MRIVFHGPNAGVFEDGFGALLAGTHEIVSLPDALDTPEQRSAYASADVIVGTWFGAALPHPTDLTLFLVPGAGYDAVDLARLPAGAVVCNCFGHEQAIAEYVMAALLRRHIPLDDADRRLRQGDWAYQSGAADRVHGEMAGTTIGLLGFGHIGKAIATRAKAFDMTVHVANRSPVSASGLVDRSFTLDRLPAFWASAEAFVISIPLADDTRGFVGHDAFAAMRPEAVVVNVGRGGTIDEDALYAALETRRIAGAVIDTWYRYPSAAEPVVQPSRHPFAALPNVLMTPHMSGWTTGTIRRRQATMAENVRRRIAGEACVNVVRGSHPA